MTVKSVAALKAFIDANRTSNGANTNTGATENEILNDIVDSFFSKLGTPAVTGSGAANRITRWASANVAESGTWTNAGNVFAPVTNNSGLGTDALGVQSFHAAATTTTAPINLKSSVGVIPTGTNRKSGMLLWDGTSLLFHTADNTAASDLLASHPAIISDRIPRGTGSSVEAGTWVNQLNDIYPNVTNSNLGKATSNVIEKIFGKDFTLGELAADTGNLYLAYPTHFNATDFALVQIGSSGDTFVNGKTNLTMSIGGAPTQFKLVANKVQLALNSAHTVEIGSAIGSPTGALIYTSGKGDTSATINVDLTNQSESVIFRFRDDGHFGAGGITTPTAFIHAAASTTSEASLRLQSGVDPTSPNDGDIWNDGTHFMGRGSIYNENITEVITITKTHTQFQTAATTNSLEIYVAAAGEKIYDVIQEPTVVFAGTGITAYTSEIGITTDTDKYGPSFDVTQNTDQQDNNNANIPSWTGTTSIKATVNSIGANLDQSTAGSITYKIRTKKFK